MEGEAQGEGKGGSGERLRSRNARPGQLCLLRTEVKAARNSYLASLRESRRLSSHATDKDGRLPSHTASPSGHRKSVVAVAWLKVLLCWMSAVSLGANTI